MEMDIVIKYKLPQEIFNQNKRPPGHVCDPLIRQAARTATKLLEDLGLPHQVTYVDQRDHPRADTPIAFYGVQIDLEAPGRRPQESPVRLDPFVGRPVGRRTVLQAPLSAGLPRSPGD